MIKRTKIVATLSVQRCTEELVRSLFKAGMNIVRINSAHASLENAAEIIRMVRSVSNSIPVMLDTKGPEIRVTRMDDAYPDGIRFAAGDRVKVRGTSVKTDIPSTREVIYMNVEHIVRDVPAGATMLIADGEMELHVEQKSAEELVCRVMRDCTLRSRKSVNVPNVSIDLPSVTEKDRMYIEWATENGVDFIAHSFVRSARPCRIFSTPTAATSRSSRRSRTRRGSTTSTRSSKPPTASWWRAATWASNCLPRSSPSRSG